MCVCVCVREKLAKSPTILYTTVQAFHRCIHHPHMPGWDSNSYYGHVRMVSILRHQNP